MLNTAAAVTCRSATANSVIICSLQIFRRESPYAFRLGMNRLLIYIIAEDTIRIPMLLVQNYMLLLGDVESAMLMILLQRRGLLETGIRKKWYLYHVENMQKGA